MLSFLSATISYPVFSAAVILAAQIATYNLIVLHYLGNYQEVQILPAFFQLPSAHINTDAFAGPC